jgi:hypothetical protein
MGQETVTMQKKHKKLSPITPTPHQSSVPNNLAISSAKFKFYHARISIPWKIYSK